jgi:hypothetical protein
LTVDAFGSVAFDGQSFTKPRLSGVTAVAVTASALAPIGIPQFDADPPCGAKLVALKPSNVCATLATRRRPTSRVSTMRHGVIGV